MSDAQQEKPADAWGQPISAERQRELQGYLDRWEGETDHGERKSPFDGVHMKGNDVYWLTLVRSEEIDRLGYDFPDPRINLRGAELPWAQLGGADLEDMYLDGATLGGAYLQGVHLYGASMQETDLRGAHLENAYGFGVNLKGSDMFAAHLEGADLQEDHLEGTTLSEAFFDAATNLRDALLTTDRGDFASIADVRWGGVNLGSLAGPLRPPLGDERGASSETRSLSQ